MSLTFKAVVRKIDREGQVITDVPYNPMLHSALTRGDVVSFGRTNFDDTDDEQVIDPAPKGLVPVWEPDADGKWHRYNFDTEEFELVSS